MKWVFAALMFAVAQMACAGTSPAADYVAGIHQLRMECNDKASLLHTQENIESMGASMAYRMRGEVGPTDISKSAAAASELKSCIATAKEKATAQFKAFASEESSIEMKAGGKALYVAFLSYLDVLLSSGSLDDAVDSMEGTAYTQARNSMQAEIALAQ